jgi:MinD-like ATPase involved in chromosome partitioning or flagellar assembly
VRLPFLRAQGHGGAVPTAPRVTPTMRLMDSEQVRPAIRVAVAAPFPQLVAIHRRAAEYADEIELCGAISDATRVLEQTRRLQPEVLLLSDQLGFDEAEFFARLTAIAPATRLVMLVEGDAGGARFADAMVSGDASALELREAIAGAAGRIDADTAPPAHARQGAVGIGDAFPEPDETRWFSEMHDQVPAAASGPASSDDATPASAAAASEPVAPAAAAGSEDSAAATKPAEQRYAHTVLVFSGKGGVGKSVVATNLATALAMSGSQVALVDLNLQYGDAGVLLHLESHPTTIEALAAVASAGARLDAQSIDAAMATTPEGLRVLLAPRSPEFADLVTAASLGAILNELARTHDYLVVDSPAHLEERILGVIEMADLILLVTSSNITAVKDTKTTLRLLQSLGIEAERVAVVLNQTRTRGSFAAEDIERSLRFPLLARLPYEPRMDESIDSGRPLVLSEPRSGFSKQLRLVVEHLGRQRAASAGRSPAERPFRWRLRFSPH